jgi:hypothetical protein
MQGQEFKMQPALRFVIAFAQARGKGIIRLSLPEGITDQDADFIGQIFLD